MRDTTDPLTLNRYAYVKNSPLNYIDPSGHRTKATSYFEGSGSWTESVNGGENYPAAIFISNDDRELCLFKEDGEILLNNQSGIWNRSSFKDIILNKKISYLHN